MLLGRIRIAVIVVLCVAGLMGCASTATSESTGEFLDSSLITAKIKAMLLDDAETSGMSIKVNTYKGAVQLSGFVDSDKMKQRAEQLAQSVAGVKSIQNDLIVKAK